MVEKKYGSMGDLKIGKYVLIEDVACRVVSIDKSKPGKHGAAKMNVVAIGIFDDVKRTIMKPTDADVEIPIIERKRAQVVSVTGTSAQLMDTQSYETFEVELPEDMRAEVESGKEIEYMEAMGRKLLTRVRGGE
jgi:translation initiation factor 5A